MKTAISIPDPLFHSAERVARRLHMSRSRFYATAVSRHVHELEKTNVTERLNAVYSKLGGPDSALPTPIVQMQARSLAEERW